MCVRNFGPVRTIVGTDYLVERGCTRILRIVCLLDVLMFRYTCMGPLAFVALPLQELTTQQSGFIAGKVPVTSWFVRGLSFIYLWRELSRDHKTFC